MFAIDHNRIRNDCISIFAIYTWHITHGWMKSELSEICHVYLLVFTNTQCYAGQVEILMFFSMLSFLNIIYQIYKKIL